MKSKDQRLNVYVDKLLAILDEHLMSQSKRWLATKVNELSSQLIQARHKTKCTCMKCGAEIARAKKAKP